VARRYVPARGDAIWLTFTPNGAKRLELLEPLERLEPNRSKDLNGGILRQAQDERKFKARSW
jgi:hypothetical protein